jgi:hypothetical protein
MNVLRKLFAVARDGAKHPLFALEIAKIGEVIVGS